MRRRYRHDTAGTVEEHYEVELELAVVGLGREHNGRVVGCHGGRFAEQSAGQLGYVPVEVGVLRARYENDTDGGKQRQHEEVEQRGLVARLLVDGAEEGAQAAKGRREQHHQELVELGEGHDAQRHAEEVDGQTIEE